MTPSILRHPATAAPASFRRQRGRSLTAWLLGAALVCAGCGPAGTRVGYSSVSAVPGVDAELFTILHLFEAGRQSVEAHLAAAGEDGAALRATIARASSAVVRVHVRTRFEGTSYTSENGSGVLVADGRYVLTAGHVMEALRHTQAAKVTVSLVDGTRLKASPVEWDYEVYGGAERDWAVLEVLEAVPAGFPSLELAAPRSGSSVVLLGYPAHVGIRPDGRLGYDLDDGGSALAPQVMLGRIEDASAVDVVPLVGCLPEGGMSGGPVVDRAGHLIAVLSSVSHSRDGDGVRFFVEAAPLERAAAWLANAPRRPEAKPR